MKLYKILEINGICININLSDTLTLHIRPNRYFGAIFREKERSFCCQIFIFPCIMIGWRDIFMRWAVTGEIIKHTQELSYKFHGKSMHPKAKDTFPIYNKNIKRYSQFMIF